MGYQNELSEYEFFYSYRGNYIINRKIFITALFVYFYGVCYILK